VLIDQSKCNDVGGDVARINVVLDPRPVSARNGPMDADSPSHLPVHDCVRHWVNLDPDRVAAIDSSRPLTFRELERASASIAMRLRAACPHPERSIVAGRPVTVRELFGAPTVVSFCGRVLLRSSAAGTTA
jgi:hypothetical protein